MLKNAYSRRQFLGRAVGAAAGLAIPARAAKRRRPQGDNEPLFKISLAQWSLHRTLRRGDLDHLDFIQTAHQDYGIDAVEYVNTFFFDHAKDSSYLQEMKSRADGEGVVSLLIMCDAEGRLGDPDDGVRATTVQNHYKWIEAAEFLGCHSIRVNAASEGTWDEQMKLASDGLRRVTEYGDEHGINVVVENHGGISSNGQWLAGVIEMVGHSRCGTLPDFGNFQISDTERYDNYQGLTELMPYAKAVSAKSHDFDEEGNETELDYRRLLRIVLDAGYRGYVGIEYEGDRLSEPDGIRATRALLERVRDELTESYGAGSNRS